MASDIWNSPLARFIVPDKVSFSLGGDVGWWVGAGAQPINLTVLTRSRDPGLYLTPSVNINAGMLAKGEGSYNITRSWYTGNPREITSSMLQGHTAGVNVSITAVAGGSAGISYSPVDPENPVSGGGFLNLNVGVTGGAGFSVSGQYQYTPGVTKLFGW